MARTRRTTRATFHVPVVLLEEIRGMVAHFQAGQFPTYTFTDFVTVALEQHLERKRHEWNNGHHFPLVKSPVGSL